MSIAIPTNCIPVDEFDIYINTTCIEIQTTFRKWESSWLYTLALLHHYNEADLQVAHIERDTAKHFDTIAEARTMEFVSQG